MFILFISQLYEQQKHLPKRAINNSVKYDKLIDKFA